MRPIENYSNEVFKMAVRYVHLHESSRYEDLTDAEEAEMTKIELTFPIAVTLRKEWEQAELEAAEQSRFNNLSEVDQASNVIEQTP